jgi:hypothetical protein
VIAKTGAGAIRIGRLTRGQAELVNGSGNIEIGISEGSAAQVDASSERGTVRNSVPPQENTGTVENKVTVHARTRHGDITIHRAGTPHQARSHRPHAAGGDAGPAPAPVARMAAVMSARSSSFSSRLAAGSHPST